MTSYIYGLCSISVGWHCLGSLLSSRGSKVYTHVSFSDNMPFPLFSSLPYLNFFGPLSPFRSD